MKTWLENNWLARLEKLFASERLTENLPTLENNGTPKTLTALKPENVESFKKLWRDYFSIYISIPEKPTTNSPSLDTVLRKFKKRLLDLHGRVAARPESAKSGKAREFYENVIHCAISMFQADARKYVEACRSCNLESLKDTGSLLSYYMERFWDNIDPNDAETYIEHWYTPIEQTLEELEKDALKKSNNLVNISANDYTNARYPGLLGIHFDVRNIESATDFIVNIVPKNAFAGTSIDSSNLSKLKFTYKCSSLTNSLKETEDGFNSGTGKEMAYCSENYIRYFQENVYQSVKSYFVPLSEDLYNTFVDHASQWGYSPACEETGAPSIEALRVAEFTEDMFNNSLGGRIIANNRELAIVHRRKTMTLPEFKERWKWWYKADVLYIYSVKDKGNIVRYCLPIQVKYREGNSNTKIDSKPAEAPVRKFLCEASNIEGIARRVALALLGGDYVLTEDSWKEWTYIPFTTKAIQFKKRTDIEDNVEVYIDLTVAGWDMRLRVPRSTHSSNTLTLIRP